MNIYQVCICVTGFPGGSDCKESVCSAGSKPGFDPWVEKKLWRRKWQPTPVFCLKNPMGRGIWQTTIHRVTKLDTTEQLSTHMCYEHCTV